MSLYVRVCFHAGVRAYEEGESRYVVVYVVMYVVMYVVVYVVVYVLLLFALRVCVYVIFTKRAD